MTTPAFIALTAAASAYVEARNVQYAAEHLHRIRLLSRAPGSVINAALEEWNLATAAAGEAYHNLSQATLVAQRAVAAASVPHPAESRLPFVVEMASYARQAEMKRRFEKDCG
jgi:hypothetical protein